jgi:hypothetical protein
MALSNLSAISYKAEMSSMSTHSNIDIQRQDTGLIIFICLLRKQNWQGFLNNRKKISISQSEQSY